MAPGPVTTTRSLGLMLAFSNRAWTQHASGSVTAPAMKSTFSGSVRPLPEKVDFIAGAVTEPLACCVHALLEKASIKPSDLVVVTGPGAIGLLSTQVALACGATVVLFGTGVDAPRLEMAKQLGAHYTVNLEEQSVAALV